MSSSVVAPHGNYENTYQSPLKHDGLTDQAMWLFPMSPDNYWNTRTTDNMYDNSENAILTSPIGSDGEMQRGTSVAAYNSKDGRFATLCARAILAAPQQRETLQGIYTWIRENQFSLVEDRPEHTWQSTIRHTLCANKAFVRVKVQPSRGTTMGSRGGTSKRALAKQATEWKGGRSKYWGIDPAMRHCFDDTGAYLGISKRKDSPQLSALFRSSSSASFSTRRRPTPMSPTNSIAAMDDNSRPSSVPPLAETVPGASNLGRRYSSSFTPGSEIHRFPRNDEAQGRRSSLFLDDLMMENMNAMNMSSSEPNILGPLASGREQEQERHGSTGDDMMQSLSSWLPTGQHSRQLSAPNSFWSPMMSTDAPLTALKPRSSQTALLSPSSAPHIASKSNGTWSSQQNELSGLVRQSPSLTQQPAGQQRSLPGHAVGGNAGGFGLYMNHESNVVGLPSTQSWIAYQPRQPTPLRQVHTWQAGIPSSNLIGVSLPQNYNSPPYLYQTQDASLLDSSAQGLNGNSQTPDYESLLNWLRGHG